MDKIEHNDDWRIRFRELAVKIESRISALESSRKDWRSWALRFYKMVKTPPYTPEDAVKTIMFMEEFDLFCEEDNAQPTQHWRPIEEFNGDTFTIMTNGIPEGTEVVKYKGEIPAWARWWMPLPTTPR